ncbi:hypothetical protein [Vibrio sp. ED002]|uniref:hypothetical protein n=1 Tax=Vibrio sp. ED002 TaxID=2785123 RepID=UPI0020105168|nr:hypothetical protein [Vibrio sp. ED002]UQA51684.1 hypothetical protein ITG12_04965 [Vibrio sp. ED002]
MKKLALLLALFATTASAENTLFPFSQSQRYINQTLCHTATVIVTRDIHSKEYERFLKITADIQRENNLSDVDTVGGMMWALGYAKGTFVSASGMIGITEIEYAKKVINDVCSKASK